MLQTVSNIGGPDAVASCLGLLNSPDYQSCVIIALSAALTPENEYPKAVQLLFEITRNPAYHEDVRMRCVMGIAAYLVRKNRFVYLITEFSSLLSDDTITTYWQLTAMTILMLNGAIEVYELSGDVQDNPELAACSQRLVRVIIKLLQHAGDHDHLIKRSLQLLGNLKHIATPAIPIIGSFSNHQDQYVRDEASRALRKIQGIKEPRED